MTSRPALALLVLTVATLVSLRAGDPPQGKKVDDPNQIREDLTLREQILSRQFSEFEQSLLKLMQRLRASPKQEDRERAVVLQKALEQAKDKAVGTQFEQLVDLLKIQQLKSVGDIKTAADRSARLAENLREILELLRQDTRTAKLREERSSLEKLIKELEKVIHEQKVAELITRRGKTDPQELKNIQHKVTKATENIAKKLGSKAGGDPKDQKKSGKGDGKNADGKKSQSKESEGAKKGEGKSGAKAKDGKAAKGSGEGQGKSNGQEGAKQGDKKDQKKDDKEQPQIAQANNGKKQVEDANDFQKQAEKHIDKGDNKQASDKENDAVTKLEEARKKLEALLRQLREEELERLLANLQARCEKMLAMQMQVLSGTEGVFRSITGQKEKKASRLDQQQSLRLSDDEKDIVTEASKAIELLEAEGSAVAFPEVFKQVREDMKHVQRRLGIVDVAEITQAIEKDIIDTLKEMIEALKKARQELENSKSPPSNQPPPDQKLLDQIAELKMILAMQIRVDARTRIYGSQYPGEQAADPNIARELRNLSERQERIFDVTNRIAKGDNR